MRATGLFVEMGPLLLSSQSVRTSAYNDTGVPTLYRNPYAWTKVANVLILNGPAPVGYSYCTPAGPSGDGNSCGCVVANPQKCASWAAWHGILVCGRRDSSPALEC